MLYGRGYRSRFEKNKALPTGAPPRERTVPLYLSLAGLAFRRPRALPDLLRAAWAFRSRGWYRSPPFLPLPPRSYLRWRLDTAYGDPEATPSPDEVERYLAWGTAMRRGMRRGTHA